MWIKPEPTGCSQINEPAVHLMKWLANILRPPFFFFLHLGEKVVAIRLENRSHHMISFVIPVHHMTSGVEEIHSEEQGGGRINQILTMEGHKWAVYWKAMKKKTTVTSITLLMALIMIRKILRSYGIPSHIVTIMCTAQWEWPTHWLSDNRTISHDDVKGSEAEPPLTPTLGKED